MTMQTHFTGVLRATLGVLVAGIASCSSTTTGRNGSRMWISQVHFQDPRTETYLGSPSLVRMPDGAILAIHDYFGNGAPKNAYGEDFLTSLYRSEDDGRTWRHITLIPSCYWSTIFEHRGSAYIIGVSASSEHIVIRRSDNGGYTWTRPTSDTTGRLFVGGRGPSEPSYHNGPAPVLKYGGRIWRAYEDNDKRGEFGPGFKVLVISADESSDLLRADSWRMSNKLPYDQGWNPPGFGDQSGWLEGNAVAGPDGRVWDILRLNSFPALNRAAMVSILDEGRRVEFNPATGFIDMPGGTCRFTIRRDPKTGLYWALVNDMEDDATGRPRVRRNRLSAISSPDLRSWTKRATLIEYYKPTAEEATRTTGFQYTDWQFDGDDIIYLTRTAFDGAHSFHDANRITFGRVEDFRQLVR